MNRTETPPQLAVAAWLALLILSLSGCLPKAAEPVTPFQAAQKQMADKQWSEARRSLERELVQHPDNLDARYDLALLLADNGHDEDAAALYRENLEHGWHLPSAINLAQYLLQTGDDAAAETLLQQATKQSPHEAIPWYLLAERAASHGQWQLADERFQLALKADPKNGFAHLRYARFLAARKQLDKAQRQGLQGIRLLPGCAPCWRQYGDILQDAGKYPEAIAAYQRSLAISPTVHETRQQLIHALRAKGDNERADRMQRALDAFQAQSRR